MMPAPAPHVEPILFAPHHGEIFPSPGAVMRGAGCWTPPHQHHAPPSPPFHPRPPPSSAGGGHLSGGVPPHGVFAVPHAQPPPPPLGAAGYATPVRRALTIEQPEQAA